MQELCDNELLKRQGALLVVAGVAGQYEVEQVMRPATALGYLVVDGRYECSYRRVEACSAVEAVESITFSECPFQGLASV